jgi:sec-independent protein translocase protein TatB
LSFLGMDIGWGEILIILIVALVVVGPEKLPSYARKGARLVRNIQKVTTNLTGQISKAINLDDEEGGKASDFKKDLMAAKKSLEKDVAELKSSFDEQAKVISKTLDEGTKDVSQSLKQSANEISSTLSAQVNEIKTTLDAQAEAVSKTVEAGVRETAASIEQATAEVPVPAGASAPPVMVSAPPEPTVIEGNGDTN